MLRITLRSNRLKITLHVNRVAFTLFKAELKFCERFCTAAQYTHTCAQTKSEYNNTARTLAQAVHWQNRREIILRKNIAAAL